MKKEYLDRVKSFREYLLISKERSRKTLDEFASDFKKDAFHAFCWSGNVVFAAAQLDVVSSCIERNVKTIQDMRQLRVHFLGSASRHARWPSNSTSKMSDYASLLKTSAYFEVISQIDQMLLGVPDETDIRRTRSRK